MITIHQRHRRTDRRTDRQTDRQTTCDRNTALCTKVHHAVKIAQNSGRIIATAHMWLTSKAAYNGTTIRDHDYYDDLIDQGIEC